MGDAAAAARGCADGSPGTVSPRGAVGLSHNGHMSGAAERHTRPQKIQWAVTASECAESRIGPSALGDARRIASPLSHTTGRTYRAMEACQSLKRVILEPLGVLIP